MEDKEATTRSATLARLTPSAIGLALLLGSAPLAVPAHAARDQDCVEVAQSQLKACRNSALDDYWVSIGICDNDAADDPKGRCPATASHALSDARVECNDQLDARTAICEQLGGGKYDPVIERSRFSHSTTISNPFFPLKPGTTLIYEGKTAQGVERDTFAVTRHTHTFLGIECVEVHDTVTLDGQVTEDTLDWFAQDDLGNVWYFGEQSFQVEDGIVAGIEGSWQAGVEEAKPGIVMEARPKVGDDYRQEYKISDAEDDAEVVAVGQTATAHGKTYHDVLVTHEFSGLEPSASERKFYAPNVGNVLVIDDETGDVSALIEITTH